MLDFIIIRWYYFEEDIIILECFLVDYDWVFDESKDVILFLLVINFEVNRNFIVE